MSTISIIDFTSWFSPGLRIEQSQKQVELKTKDPCESRSSINLFFTYWIFDNKQNFSIREYLYVKI